jgi:hypothetical protein
MTRFLNVLQDSDKELGLRKAIAGGLVGRSAYEFPASELRLLRGSPFAYWAPTTVLALLANSIEFEPNAGSVRVGVQTDNDTRFVRLWWERPVDDESSSETWCPLLKGGGAERFYGDVSTEIRWTGSGHELRASLVDVAGGRINNDEFYFRPGISWALRTSRFSPTVVPYGCIPTVSRYLAVVEDGAVLAYVALWSSVLFDALCKLRMERSEHPKFIIGVVKGLPRARAGEPLADLALSGWSARRSLDTAVEVSHAFVVPAVLQVAGADLAERVSEWSAKVVEVEGELARVQSEIDELCFDLYEISEEDRRSIVAGFGVVDAGGENSDAAEAEDDGGEDFAGLVELDPADLAAGLVSWAVGVAVGRFDVRLAIGERGWPVEPDPFDPLPVGSLGMLTGDDGLLLIEPPAGYPVSVSSVLVDDPGHPLDVTAQVRSVFDAVFGDDADEWWSSVGGALGARGGEIGGWLAKGFFDYHLKAYSRSRRKAPVLWPIGTKSGSYLVWLYAHQVSADSLFRVMHDVVGPKLGVEERELTRLRQDAGMNPSLSQRKAIDAQEQFVGELREMREELEAVAPLWAPDLSDGTVIVLAPLWKLFAHHRPWSNELKKHWAKLAKGDYDWAQLAMHLWPERVIPKCAADRSLAIAHGFEDIFWARDPDNDDRWHPRAKPTTPIDQLIAQRHNPAITAALQREST